MTFSYRIITEIIALTTANLDRHEVHSVENQCQRVLSRNYLLCMYISALEGTIQLYDFSAALDICWFGNVGVPDFCVIQMKCSHVFSYLPKTT
jgi:hypothetical protein